MLILTRRVGESLKIELPAGIPAETVLTTTILGVKGNQVRIGVDAPKEVAVHREEIFNKILAERDPLQRDVFVATEQVLSSEQLEKRAGIADRIRQRREVNGNSL